MSGTSCFLQKQKSDGGSAGRVGWSSHRTVLFFAVYVLSWRLVFWSEIGDSWFVVVAVSSQRATSLLNYKNNNHKRQAKVKMSVINDRSWISSACVSLQHTTLSTRGDRVIPLSDGHIIFDSCLMTNLIKEVEITTACLQSQESPIQDCAMKGSSSEEGIVECKLWGKLSRDQKLAFTEVTKAP